MEAKRRTQNVRHVQNRRHPIFVLIFLIFRSDTRRKRQKSWSNLTGRPVTRGTTYSPAATAGDTFPVGRVDRSVRSSFLFTKKCWRPTHPHTKNNCPARPRLSLSVRLVCYKGNFHDFYKEKPKTTTFFVSVHRQNAFCVLQNKRKMETIDVYTTHSPCHDPLAHNRLL
jgi:hypothetical protein